eukprot:TRINITY_DN7937_c0_g1_i1.p1 TRINITY_DN7937_c0_g1~~TRINITY_DN7937_c0_g1_i1.p1  ORF type:complete len:417 (-),score=86.50 TRINITY_DN7937_c0_g1_i1:77-1327(-)
MTTGRRLSPVPQMMRQAAFFLFFLFAILFAILFAVQYADAIRSVYPKALLSDIKVLTLYKGQMTTGRRLSPVPQMMRQAAFFLFFLFAILFAILFAVQYADAIRSVYPKALLSDIKVLTLYKGQMTTGRRLSPVPQIKCVGGSAAGLYEPAVIQCHNMGSDGIYIKWRCETTLPSEYKLGELHVSCEGYDRPSDTFVLAGSCGLEYHLEYSKTNEISGGYQSGSSGWLDVIVILLILVTSLYLLIKYLQKKSMPPSSKPYLNSPFVQQSSPVPQGADVQSYLQQQQQQFPPAPATPYLPSQTSALHFQSPKPVIAHEAESQCGPQSGMGAGAGAGAGSILGGLSAAALVGALFGRRSQPVGSPYHSQSPYRQNAGLMPPMGMRPSMSPFTSGRPSSAGGPFSSPHPSIGFAGSSNR